MFIFYINLTPEKFLFSNHMTNMYLVKSVNVIILYIFNPN